MGIQKSTTVMYRSKDGSVAKMPLVQAYAQKRKDQAGHLKAPSLAAAKSLLSGRKEVTNPPAAAAAAFSSTVNTSNNSSYVPGNHIFIANKNDTYTPPSGATSKPSVVIPNSSNRKTRNKLSDEPLNYFNPNDELESTMAESL